MLLYPLVVTITVIQLWETALQLFAMAVVVVGASVSNVVITVISVGENVTIFVVVIVVVGPSAAQDGNGATSIGGTLTNSGYHW